MLVAVAMDASGISACKPYYESAKATFVTLVDSQNALSGAFGFGVVPNGFLIDEAGVLQYKKLGGFDINRPDSVAAIDEFLARSKAVDVLIGRPVPPETVIASLRTAISEVSGDPNSSMYESHFELGRLLASSGKHEEALPHLESAVDGMKDSAPAKFALGSCLLAQDKTDEALSQFKAALKLEPTNYVIRKQIWLIEHPDKFHPEIDWNWQREQLKKELEQERKDGGG